MMVTTLFKIAEPNFFIEHFLRRPIGQDFFFFLGLLMDLIWLYPFYLFIYHAMIVRNGVQKESVR